MGLTPLEGLVMGTRSGDVDPSLLLFLQTTTLQPADPIPVTTATKMISEGRVDELLGQVIAAFHGSTATADIVVIEGLRPARGDPRLGSLNQELVKTLTGESGSGAGVDKVCAATKLAQSKRPDLLIDGPLQYDAAFMPDVAKTKAPVNDLSRGALVDDIVYTIALTAIQATQV